MPRGSGWAAAGALSFWIAVGLVQKFNWGLGVAKALVLLMILVATPFVAAAARRQPGPDEAPGPAPRPLIWAALLLLALQSAYALWQLRHPDLMDMATTTLAAADALRAGANPYASAIDPGGLDVEKAAPFDGYKYLPVTIAAYLPLGALWGERGVVLTNLLLLFATVALVFRLAQRIAGASAAWLAALLFLSLPLVPFQLFTKGATDLSAVVPLLLALLLLERRPALAGLSVGLSIAAKVMPGALLLLCCLPGRPRARLGYGIGAALGLLPVLPFLLWSPGAFFDNIVRFTLERRPDGTSWLASAPAGLGILAHGLVLAALLAAAAYVWRSTPSLVARVALAAVLILLALLAGPVAHHNYQLWWLPLLTALLGAALLPVGAPQTGYAAAQKRQNSN